MSILMDVSELYIYLSIIMDNKQKRIKFIQEFVTTDIENDIPDGYSMILIEIENDIPVRAYIVTMPPESLKSRYYPYIPN